MGQRAKHPWTPTAKPIDFIFHNSVLLELSPAATVWWHGKGKAIDLLNRLPADTWGASLPSQQCGMFVVACAALPEVGPSGVWLANWAATGPGPANPDDLEWFQRALAEAAAFQSRPFVVDLNPPFEARQGGKALCRWVAGEYKEGGPVWVAPG